MHERAVIRDDTVARLKGKTAAGQKVYPSRTAPFEQEDLPVLRIYTPTQTDQGVSIANPVFKRALDLNIEIIATAATDALLDDAADNIAEAIKNTLMKDAAWVLQFERILSINTQLGVSVEGGGRRIGAVITFSLQLKSEIYEPTITDGLETVDIEVDFIDPSMTVPGPDGQIEGEVEIAVEPPP